MKKRKKLFLIILISIILLIVFCLTSIDARANILLASTAEAKIRARVSSLANQCVIDAVALNEDFSNLINVSTDVSGNVSHVRADSVLMNKLAYNAAKYMQKQLDDIGVQEVSIKWSALFGSDLFSGMGPSVGISVQPIGNITTRYISEFISAGINQTRHRMYLEIDCEVTVVMPSSNNNVNITSQVVVSECLIVGKVPNSYVYVDETDKMLNLIPD